MEMSAGCVCPVCNTHRVDSESFKCGRCENSGAYEEYFASEKTYEKWRDIQKELKESFLKKFYGKLKKSFELITSEGRVILHNKEKSRALIISDNEEQSVIEDVKQISASNAYQLVLHNDLTVTAHGDNEYGQCETSGLKDISFVLAAPRCSYAVKTDGTVVAKGACPIREEISRWSGIKALACGSQHIAGLRNDGTVVQTAPPSTCVSEETSGWKNVTAIAAAANYTIGLHEDGRVSFAGALSDKRREVENWTNIVAIAADTQYAIGVTDGGEVLLAGECSLPFIDMNRSKAKLWKEISLIAAGHCVIAAITNDGQIKLAGNVIREEETCKKFISEVTQVM